MKEKREVYCCLFECMFLICGIIHYGYDNDNNNDINYQKDIKYKKIGNNNNIH